MIPLIAAFVTMGYLMNPRRNNFQKMYLDAQCGAWRRMVMNEKKQFGEFVPEKRTVT